jgi:hypothetical protein
MAGPPPEGCDLICARARAVACSRCAWRAREARASLISLSALNVARARDAMRAAARRARHACARGGAGGTHRARVMAPWRWGACCVGRACARGRLLEGGGRANLTILPQNGSAKATGVHTELEHPFSLFFTGFRRHLIELVWAPAHSQPQPPTAHGESWCFSETYEICRCSEFPEILESEI